MSDKKLIVKGLDKKTLDAYMKRAEISTVAEATVTLAIIGLHRWRALNKYNKSPKGQKALAKAAKNQSKKRSQAKSRPVKHSKPAPKKARKAPTPKQVAIAGPPREMEFTDSAA